MDQLTDTALALPEPTALKALFASPQGIDKILKGIEDEARSLAPDVSTIKGRKAIASAAAEVSRKKVAMDAAGKDLNSSHREAINSVDAQRRMINARLEALRDEVRKPLTDWEAAEEARVAAIKARLAKFAVTDLPTEAEPLRAWLAACEAVAIDATWQEFTAEAGIAKDACLARLRAALAAAEQREAEAAELARLRAEAEARAEADRVRAEAERAEIVRLAAEQAERDRLALIEAEAQAREARAAEAARAEAAEREAALIREKAQAEERAKAEAHRQAQLARDRELALQREKAEAETRHQKALADAKAREEAAAQAERNRLAAERQAEADARAKREADQAHRAKIKAAISGALAAMAGNATPGAIADALMAGKIPHCTVVM